MPIDRNSAQYITGATYKPTQTSAPGVWDLDDQANNIAKNLWPLPPQAVQRSLRFNSADSANLNRTPAVAGNRRTYTWSGWVKISTLADQVLFNAQANSSNGTQRSMITLASSGFLYANTDNLNTAMIWTVSSNNLLRDLGAWYHIVVAVDTTQGTIANRVRMYINGIEVSYASSTYPSQNYDDAINSTVSHYLAYEQHPAQSTKRFNGYMAEVNFVDGQQLTPTSFGETDPQTGVWIPKRYTGTYGTNGFRLSFANNSSTTALGYDSSGQGNNWTANNFSVTPGVGNDSLLDVPSLYGTDTGLGGEVLGNYATLNPLQTNSNGQTLSDGNLQVTMAAATDQWRTNKSGTVLPRGKWYFEATLLTMPAGSNAAIGIGYINVNQSGDTYIGKYANQGGSGIEFGAQGNTIGAAIDLEIGRADYYKNGILTVSFTGLDLTQTYEVLYAVAQPPNKVIAFNFGQRPFVYTAPTGFKALCTTNLPAPAIGQTAANQADNHFNVVTYNGSSSQQSITGLGFRPDLIWIKARSGADAANTGHEIYDAVRSSLSGITSARLTSNSTAAENLALGTNGLLSYNADGFTIPATTNYGINSSGYSYVAWCWNAGGVSVTNSAGTNNASVASTYRANKAAGFSIVTWAGSNAVGTVAHGLGAAPSFIIAKSRTTANAWGVFHQSANGGSGQNGYLLLNGTGTFTSDINAWNNTAPTANVFSVAAGGFNAGNMVAYCFAAVPGFSAFGSYTGNGSADGSFVYTGFKPAFILIKDVNNANSWILMDNKRTGAYNPQDGWLVAQATDAEYNVSTSDSRIDFLSNGFKLRNSNAGNNASRTYIYAAFAETPARLSTAR